MIKNFSTFIEYIHFIESRKCTPLTEYYEVHHILPRCLGGKDEPENLIALSYDDHTYAHKLIAQFTKHCGLQWAYHLRNKTKEPVWRKGLNHPCADTTEYCFYHPDYGVVYSTRIDFVEQYDIQRGAVNTLIKGSCKKRKGWILVETEDIEQEYEDKQTYITRGNQYTTQLEITLYHNDYGKVTAPKRYFVDTYNLSLEKIGYLLRGENFNLMGWRTTEEYVNMSAVNHPHTNKNSYTFYHPDHGEFYCTPSELRRQFPKSAIKISDVVAKRRRQTKGWILK